MQDLPIGKISGIGAYIPNTVITSEDLMHEAATHEYGVPSKYLERVSGIKERRFADENLLPSEMAYISSKMALDDAGIDPKDVDLILFCGIDKDYPEPATAHPVQASLGAWNAECFDVSNACHGIMSGLSIANAYIGTGRAECVLICTGEKPSRVTKDILRQLRQQKTRKNFHRLFGALTVGDSGGAFVITKSPGDGQGCKWMKFQSRGCYADYCYYKDTDQGIEFQMLMDKICSEGIKMHKEMISDTYKNLGWEPTKIDSVFCHQPGAKPHQQMAELAQQPIEKAPITYNYYGNLTSATLPVSMFLNRPNAGDHLLIMGAGSGLSVGQAGIVF